MKRTFKLLRTSDGHFDVASEWDRQADGEALTWDELLAYRRILLISPSGTGKTYECRDQATALFQKGEAAFYISLEAVASGGVKSVLFGQHERRFKEWLASPSQAAFFFLDSIDELQLVHKTFRDALTRLADDLAGALDRATVVVTSRPIPIDRVAFAELLPIPTLRSKEFLSGEDFVRIAVNGIKETSKQAQPNFVEAELQPLTNEQILELAIANGVKNPRALLAAIEQKNAHDFARRPQDLIELCDDWRSHERIRAHHEQVRSHVFALLSARGDRKEKAELPVERARQGAQRLALAAIVGRRLTFRHSPGADIQDTGDAPIDPRVLLQGWNPAEIGTLLERPIFGEAGYGRLRFQHRSVMEFLAACQIDELIETGKISFKQAKRLLFGLSDGNALIAKPSMRPVAGWLALLRSDVFETVLSIEPSTLLTQGDPESFNDGQSERALIAFVERYGKGQWRGIDVPDLQLARLAQSPLGRAVLAAWDRGIENPEVRELLLRLVTVGRFAACADLAAHVSSDATASDSERLEATLALSKLGDTRLPTILAAALNMTNGATLRLARWLCANLYPQDVSEIQLLKVLEKLAKENAYAGGFASTIARAITNAELPTTRLVDLLRGLAALLPSVAEVDEEEQGNRYEGLDVSALLRSVCVLLLQRGSRDTELLTLSVRALRASEVFPGRIAADQELGAILNSLASEHRRAVFASDLAHAIQIYSIRSVMYRYVHVARHGVLKYSTDTDLSWMLSDLANKSISDQDREVRLRLAIDLAALASPASSAFDRVRQAVADSKPLSVLAAELIAATTPSAEYLAMVEEQRRRDARQRRNLEDERNAWFSFWRELAERPALALAPGRMDTTLRNLWTALRKNDGSDGRWDREFMEKHFGGGATDAVRERLKQYWRNMTPTLRSERKAEEKNSYLAVWSIGLMALYAESESPQWAQLLTEAEAGIATRYALLELNHLPAWIDALTQAHPTQVQSVIGNEIADELADDTNGEQPWFSVLLQSVRQGPVQLAKLLHPRLLSWLTDVGIKLTIRPHHASIENKLRSVLRVLMHGGDSQALRVLANLIEKQVEETLDSPFLYFWMPYYFRLAPINGAQKLLHLLANSKVEKNGTAVRLIASVFNENTGDMASDWSTALPVRILAELTREFHRHVRAEDDLVHNRAYSPGLRDYAEQGRRYVFDAFMRKAGAEALEAKLEISADPLFVGLKDRIEAVARERLAEELDTNEFVADEVAALYQGTELPPKTVSDMAQVLIDRLDDLKELMLRDTGPRAAWAMVSDENALRPAIAREFEFASRGAYTVDQESVTADGKETDIRLRSLSGPQATIELKIAEKGRSANDLRNAINDQLVKKYMAAEHTRAGCLLVTVADPTRQWKHPETKAMMDRNQLQAFLDEVAHDAQMRLGGEARVLARVLDLTLRLRPEK